VKKAVRHLIAEKNCRPVANVNDEIERKRDQDEESEKPHAPADLIEYVAGKG
jgi:hypothetical protein